MINTVASCFAVLISLIAVYIARKNWRDSNRPVVVAYVDEEGSGPGLTVFNLFLHNVGTRPAVAVELVAHPEDVSRLVAKGANEKRRRSIGTVFSAESRVAVLQPSEALKTSFGLAAQKPTEQWLEYGEEISIRIRYRDVEGTSYVSHLPLKVRPRAGFGGGVWSNAS